MPNTAAHDVLREVVVVTGAFPHMAQVEITIRLCVSRRIFFKSSAQAVIDVPIRGVDGYVARAIAILLQETSDRVSLCSCLTLFQVGKTKTLLEVRKTFDYFLTLQYVSRKVCNGDFAAVEILMRVRVVTNQMARPVPLAQQSLTLFVISVFTRNKEGGFQTSMRFQRSENRAIPLFRN